MPEVSTQVRLVLAGVKTVVERAFVDPRWRAILEDGPVSGTGFRFVSPLAEGADRLTADIAQGLGYKLMAPLPFATGVYERDFPNSLDEFRRLLAGADVIELDGDPDDRSASYEAAGRYVVRNCDLLIAVWDGKAGRGRGGTAEIVHYAAHAGVLVFWIGMDGTGPNLIETVRDLRRRDAALAGEAALATLFRRIREEIAPPREPPSRRLGVLAVIARMIAGRPTIVDHPAVAYANEVPTAPSDPIWRTYATFSGVLGAKPGLEMRGVPAAAAFWRCSYLRADALSKAYAAKYRSSYVLVFLLALATVLLSVVGPRAYEKLGIVMELVFVFSIVVIAVANHVHRWHERWISYRLLAELCRKQEILAPLGRCLPFSDIGPSVPRVNEPDVIHRTDPTFWVSWFFRALQRSAPLPDGSFVFAKREAMRLARDLVAEQKSYHRDRGTASAIADRRLAIGDTLVVISAASLLVSLLLLGRMSEMQAHGLEGFARLTSAAAATLVGLRAYSEFSLLAAASARMGILMEGIEIAFDGINVDAPLASVELGTTSYHLCVITMRQIDGWAQLFQLRSLELG